MIMRCPITPLKEHAIYYGRVNAEELKEMSDLQSPKYVLNLTMCCAKLKIIVQGTPTKTCIYKFARSAMSVLHT